MGEFIVTDLGESCGLKLPAVLDFSAAEPFLQKAREIAGTPCEINASDVARFSTPCAEILIAFLREGDGNFLVRPSDAFQNAIAELGLTDEIASRTK